MASIESLTNHRLRHLNGISVRNLVIGEDDKPPFSLCFALSLPHGDDLGFFYRSLDEWNCLHPDWRFIDLTGCSHLQQVAKDFVVSVLFRSQNTGCCRLLRQWRIHITGLLYLGHEMPAVVGLPSNEEYLILQFGDSFYTTHQAECATMEDEMKEKRSGSDKMDLNLFARADEISLRESYSLSTLMRISKLAEEHLRLNELVREQQENCLFVYSETQAVRQQKCDLEIKRSRLQILQLQVDKARERLTMRAARYRQIRERNAEKEDQLLKLKEENKAKNENITTATNVYQRLRSDLREYQVQIVRRRLVLARALQAVYPIKKLTSESGSSSTRYSICNLALPDSDDFSDTGIREAHFTAAYGFTAQLLRLLSFITDVPLRYPIVVQNSRLHMRDNIVCQLDIDERNFPLQLKRQKTDRIRFAYAVFLLNRDISLLRLACGLTLRNMPSTLYNLSELLRSPLTPNCSAEAYKTAEKLIEDGTLLAVLVPQPSLSSPVVDDQPLKTPVSRPSASGINSDIFFHGDVVDLAT